MRDHGDPVPDPPSTPRNCSCGAAFLYSSVVAGLRVYHGCPNCDLHGNGCTDRSHEPGKCSFPPASVDPNDPWWGKPPRT